jgi:hypothetical protein
MLSNKVDPLQSITSRQLHHNPLSSRALQPYRGRPSLEKMYNLNRSRNGNGNRNGNASKKPSSTTAVSLAPSLPSIYSDNDDVYLENSMSTNNSLQRSATDMREGRAYRPQNLRVDLGRSKSDIYRPRAHRSGLLATPIVIPPPPASLPSILPPISPPYSPTAPSDRYDEPISPLREATRLNARRPTNRNVVYDKPSPSGIVHDNNSIYDLSPLNGYYRGSRRGMDDHVDPWEASHLRQDEEAEVFDDEVSSVDIR